MWRCQRYMRRKEVERFQSVTNFKVHEKCFMLSHVKCRYDCANHFQIRKNYENVGKKRFVCDFKMAVSVHK